MSCAHFLDRCFGLTRCQTSVRQELVSGLTSFMAMCYLIFVVPGMLADAGMPRESAVTAVIWVTVIITLIMGLWARFPVGVAPGLGITAFFAYYVCGPAGYSWQTGLGAVFISGVFFMLLTVTRVRQMIIDAVPMDLKYAIVVGIGAFIAFIGMKNCGLIVADPSTFVALGDLSRPSTLLSVFGVCLCGVLMTLNVRGALIIGIVVVTGLGLALGLTPPPDKIFSASVPLPTETFAALDIRGALSHGLLSIIFTLTMVDLFDNMGTLIGLSIRANMLDHKTGHIEGLEKALFSDSVATMASGVIGTPTCTSYIESAAAIAEGGRTGIVPIVSAILFLLCLFALPFVTVVPAYATASALIVVGGLMMQSVVHINFKDFSTGMPAFLTIITMPLTFNVATGFGLGFISYVFLKLLTNQNKDLNIVTILVALAFGINFMMR